MHRKLLALAASAVLALAIAAPVTAATTQASTTGGFAHNCPSIANGLGGYTPATGSLDFFMVLSSASCKQATYTLTFYAVDNAGNVSATPALTQSWTGDGVATQFEASNAVWPNGTPTQLCVIGTVEQSKKVTHVAPADGSCYSLDSNSGGGSPFRG